MSDKTFAQLQREENDRLRFKMRCNAMKGKTFTLAEAIEISEQRSKELQELENDRD